MMKQEPNKLNRNDTIETGENCVKLDYSGNRLLAHCPTRSERAMGTKFKGFPVPGGQAIWWRCSVCRSWHVMTIALQEA